MDVLTKKQRSYCMSRIKSRDTVIEKSFRRSLRKAGLQGYRTKAKIIGRPDIYFPSKKFAVFIDGCFWHKCPICYKKPKTNVEFWCNKIENNKKRDEKVNATLKKAGVKILRLWEHTIKKNPDLCLNKIRLLYDKK
jgi:DNA mismatch endonuclease (patch repair protein)